MHTTYSPKRFGQMSGRSVNTIQQRGRRGVLKAPRSPTHRRDYPQDPYLAYRGLRAQERGKVMAYTRVSSAGQPPDVAQQVAALPACCAAHGEQPDEWIEEIGSGLNYQRTRCTHLRERLERGPVRRRIMAQQDRLVRVGFAWFAACCARHGTQLLIVNGDTLSPEHELVQDLLAIVHVAAHDGTGSVPITKVIRHAALHQDQAPGQ